jgi:hypothetical protein
MGSTKDTVLVSAATTTPSTTRPLGPYVSSSSLRSRASLAFKWLNVAPSRPPITPMSSMGSSSYTSKPSWPSRISYTMKPPLPKKPQLVSAAQNFIITRTAGGGTQVCPVRHVG